MTKYSRENKYIVIIIVAFITLMAVVYSNNISESNLKEELQNQKYDTKVAIGAAKKLSDIEILESYVASASRNTERYLIEIESDREYVKLIEGRILENTDFYERSELRKRCNIEQMSRKAKGLEYDIDYCKEDENVQQFRTKKY